MSLLPKRQLVFASFSLNAPPGAPLGEGRTFSPTRFFTVTPGAKAFRACTQCSNARGWAVALGHLLRGRETPIGAGWSLALALFAYAGDLVLGGRWRSLLPVVFSTRN